MLLVKNKISPFLKNKRFYLIVRLSTKKENKNTKTKKRNFYRYAIIEIPSNHLPRFVTLLKTNDEKIRSQLVIYDYLKERRKSKIK